MSQAEPIWIESPSAEVATDTQTHEATRITVMVNLDTVTLEIQETEPMPRTAGGADVVWNFVVSRQGQKVGLKGVPAGWSPMVLFEPTPEGFGPFTHLTQVVELDPEGQVRSMTVEGHLARAGRHIRTGSARVPYHAVLYRGVGGDLVEGRNLSLMISELAFLELSASQVQPLPRLAPHRRSGKTHNLEVLLDSDSNKLDVFPSSYPSAGPDDRVVWDFKIQQSSFIPLILFYDFRPHAGTRIPQVSFGPFERLSMSRRCVEGSQLNAFAGHYHYEAAILSGQNLSLQFLSSGDPVVDNEGIGSPVADPTKR